MSGPGPVSSLDVGIVGLAGRFPGAGSVSQLWDNLCRGLEAIRILGDEELAAAGVPRALLDDPDYVRARGVLENADRFDASFFGLTPREAELMDPQQRLFLECAHEALEAAGYAPDRMRGRVGVFGSMSRSDYLHLGLSARPAGVLSPRHLQETLGNEKDFLTTQVSYRLNLRGPSLDVQTACSSSLVAVHLAFQCLVSRECDVALAGGVSIPVPQNAGYLHQPGGILSRDGHCRAFDARAGGTVPGSGVAVVVLKRLEDALADSDFVHAVIKGSAVNNDGRQKVGFTAPSVDGQAEVITDALTLAGVDAETIGYVEAHGTGTALGDPIEVAALVQAFATPRRGYCAIGSLKTNLGHLDAAAGVAGLIKAVMSLEYRKLAPSSHFETPNPRIDFASTPFFVNTKLLDWGRGSAPRRAAVSAFGIGGTNAHVVLEEAPSRPVSPRSVSPQLLVLSARTKSALERATSNLAAFLRAHPDVSPSDVAYTLRVGRSEFPHRRFAVCQDVADMIRALESGDPARLVWGRKDGSAPPVAFVFPGEVDPLATAGRALYDECPPFREEAERCAALLEPASALDLRAAMHGAEADAGGTLDRSRLAPLALFVVEYALARTWMSLGVRPEAMLGEGVGEFVAACLAELLPLDEALRLLAERARLRPDLPAWEAAHEAFAARVRAAPCGVPRIPLVSSLTGTWLTVEQAVDPGYWVARLGDLSRSAEGLATLRGDGRRVLLGVGPRGSGPGGPAVPAEEKTPVVSSLGGSGEPASEWAALLAAAGHLWVRGVGLDWDRLHSSSRPRRVPLPTYPFERERYWITGGGDGAPPPDGTDRSTQRRRDRADWFYVPGWRHAIPADLEPEQHAPADRKVAWLVFRGAQGAGAGIAATLRQRGERVASVLAGERFQKLGREEYAVRPGAREDYTTLLQSLGSAELGTLGVVHAWTATAHDRPESDADTSAETARGFHSLLFLAQALGETEGGAAPRLTVVTSGLFRVTGGEELDARNATLLGLCNLLPLEYPGLSCRICELGAEEVAAPDARLVHGLLADSLSARGERVAAYRWGQRWLPTFEALRLPPAGERSPRVRKGETYLVTGGLREPGLAMARSLAEGGAGALIFQTGPVSARTPMPAEAAERRDDEMGALEEIERLRTLGAAVHTVRGDVSDSGAIEDLLSEVERRFGRVRGVVHCPPVRGAGFVQLKGAAAVDRALVPALVGTRALCEAMARRAADFVILSGSSIAFTGLAGRLEQCAVSAFLSAFASARARRAGTRIQVVSWPPPSDALSPEETSDAFTRALSTLLPEVVVSPSDFRAVVAARSVPAKGEASDPLAGFRGAPDRHGRPHALGEYVPPVDETEARIAAVWEELFGIRPIGRHDSFLDLGGSSLLAVQMTVALRRTLGVELSVSAAFETPTVAGLAVSMSPSVREKEERDRFERLMREVEALSPEDAEAQLARELEDSEDE